MGGLARRAALIAELRQRGVLVAPVDSGDHFLSDSQILPAALPQIELKTRLAAEGMKAMGMVAFCPGDFDLAGGLTMLRDLVKIAGVRVVCANLHWGNELAFPATAIVPIGPWRVGFFGVTRGDGPLPEDQGKPLLVDDPIAAARAAVAALAGKVDVVVALSHRGSAEDEDMARRVPGIDIILGAHTREVLQPPRVVGTTSIHQAGQQGREIELVHVTASGVRAEHVMLPLTRPEEPEMAKKYAQYEKAVAELNSRPPTVPPPPPPSTEPPDAYWGANLCSPCHLKQDAFWKNTPHAHAYETLVKAKKQSDVECLMCHTVAFGKARPPSPTSIVDVTGFEGVQCESCHGPGSRHNDPGIRKMASQPATCLRCHDPKQSPQFNHATWLPRMRCPSDN